MYLKRDNVRIKRIVLGLHDVKEGCSLLNMNSLFSVVDCRSVLSRRLKIAQSLGSQL